MIDVEGFTHSYRGRSVLALDRWRAGAGEHWHVRGPSGSGKTTLLHAIAGLLRPDGGRISVGGTPLDGLRGSTLDRFRGRRIGLVFQRLHLFTALGALENLLIAQHLAGLAQDAEHCRAVLDSLGVAHRAHARPAELSLGEAQRVAIGRAVVNRPEVILADEPTSSLDDASCAAVAALLVERARACGATLVVASHDARISERLAHRLDLAPCA